MAPVGWLAAGYGRSFITESAVTDLPEPDSPTSAVVSPILTSNEMRSTATVSRPVWWNTTERSRTVRRLSIGAVTSQECLARVEGVAHRLADEDQQREHDGHRQERGDAKPRRVDVVLALLEQFAERGRARGQAEAEIVERSQGHHRARQDERQERHGRNHG